MTVQVLVWAAGVGFAGYAAVSIAAKHTIDSLALEAREEFESRFPSLAESQPFGSDNNDWNAFKHAYAAAKVAKWLQEWGASSTTASTIAELSGSLREPAGYTLAGKMDLFNNHIASLAGPGAASSSQSDIGNLVQGLMGSDLVKGLSDGRLNDVAPTEKSTEDILGDFSTEAPLNLPPLPAHKPDMSPDATGALSPATSAPVVDPNRPMQGLGHTDPLVIDLDNDGVELVSAAASGVRYDFWNDGFAGATGWVGADDGFLVRDVDANGKIEGVGEMFGSPHSLEYIMGTDWESFVNNENGFAQLALLDTNADGKVSAADAAWNTLQVWQDANQDGVSQAGEMHTLASLGIASIGVNNYELEEWHGLANGGFWRSIAGNTVTHTGTVTMTDASTREIVDVWFAANHQDTVFTGDYTLDIRTLFLPTLRGYGQVPRREARSEAERVRQLLLENLLIYRADGAAIVHEVANDNDCVWERFQLRRQLMAA